MDTLRTLLAPAFPRAANSSCCSRIGVEGSVGPVYSALSYAPGDRLSVDVISSYMDVPVSLTECEEHQSEWEREGAFTPCRCVDRNSDYAYGVRLRSWRTDFGSATDDVETLAPVLAELEALLPFVMWDAAHDVSLNYFHSRAYAVAEVYYDDGANLYEGFQLVYARRVGAPVWSVIHQARLYDIDDEVIEIHGFVNSHTLKLSGSHDGRGGTSTCRPQRTPFTRACDVGDSAEARLTEMVPLVWRGRQGVLQHPKETLA